MNRAVPGWSCRIEDTFEATFSGSKVAVGQLGEGSEVNVTLGPGNRVICIEVTNPWPQTAPNQAEMSSNQTCFLCQVAPAVLSCTCQASPVLLCSQCLLTHQAKDPLIPHAILPIAAAGQDPEEYQRKFSSLKAATAQLRSNLKEMEEFEQKFPVSVDKAIDTLRQFKESVLRKLRADKEQLSTTIEAAIREAQNCLAQGTRPVSDIAKILLSSYPESLRMVFCSTYSPDLKTNVPMYVNRLVCDKCHAQHVWQVLLDCKHNICKSCFVVKVEEVKAKHGHAIDTAGKATENLVCPVLDCGSTEKISDRLLQILLGEKLEVYIHEAELICFTSKCKRCTYLSQSDEFLQFPICGCRLCVICEAEMLQAGNQVCLCGNYFDQSSINAIFTMSKWCEGGCGKRRNLVKGFTSVRCSDHINCLKCLETAMKDPSPRCRGCHRSFTMQEGEAAKQRFTRQCELYCGRLFDSCEAVALDCDCHYCENCALQVIQSRIATGQEDIWQCSVCSSAFPEVLIGKYTNLLQQAGYTFNS